MSSRKRPTNDPPSIPPATSTPDGRPHKQAGRTPEARARQLANLQSHTAALKHGAYSADKLGPERERVLNELLASFPSIRRDRLEILAGQRARITLLQRYVDQVGIIRHKQRGETYPAVGLLAREENGYRIELAKVEDLAREAGNPKGSRLAEITAALAAADDDQAPADADVIDKDGEQ